jgi:hypothetical protein
VFLHLRRRPLAPYLPFYRAEEGYEAPDEPTFAPIETADVLSARFARELTKQDLPFVGPEELEALRTELRDYLEVRVTKPLFPPSRKAIVKAIDNFVLRNFSGADCYLRFRDHFDALKWQLWTATDHEDGLSAAEHRALSEQRSWIHEYILKLQLARQAKGLPVLEQQANQVKQLESEVIGNPLSPFFGTPMSAEEFEAFKTRVEGDQVPESAPNRIFAAAAYTRIAALEKRWPPGFPVRGIHVHGTQDFDFRGTSGRDFRWHSGPSPEGRHLFFDAANNDSLEQPAGLDEKGTEAWLLENKKGDLWFDQATRRLIAVRGAKLTALAETHWYAIDRIPAAELRERLVESPIDGYTLAELPGAGSPDPSAVEKVLRALAEKGLRTLPTLVLETAEGKIVLLRIELYDGDAVMLRCRARPLPANPPFPTADNESPLRPTESTDAAPKEGAAASPAAEK